MTLCIVYSIDLRKKKSKSTELEILGSFIHKNYKQMYRGIQELKRRDLVQERGDWVAVLPHAIANKLAIKAIENIPIEELLIVFDNPNSVRLQGSFAKRINYLKESNYARDIAKRWLKSGKILGNLSDLDSNNLFILKYISPIIPEHILLKIESEVKYSQIPLTSLDTNIIAISEIIRSIGFDESLFKRAVKLLCHFALQEEEVNNVNSKLRDNLNSLFEPSITAPDGKFKHKLELISQLFSEDKKSQKLGLELLNTALSSGNVVNSLATYFRPTSIKLSFLSKNDKSKWYSICVEFLSEQFKCNPGLKDEIRLILSNNFRGLWQNGNITKILEKAVLQIGSESFWPDGWLAILQTLNMEIRTNNDDSVVILKQLESFLAPKTLEQKIDACAFSVNTDVIYAIDKETIYLEHDPDLSAEHFVRKLGQEISKNEILLNDLLVQILSKPGKLLFYLGKGIADSHAVPNNIWDQFANTLRLIDPLKRNMNVCYGFLSSLYFTDKNLYNSILDSLSLDEVFSDSYLKFQCSMPIDSLAIDRLILTIKSKKVLPFENKVVSKCKFIDAVPRERIYHLIKEISKIEKDGLTSMELFYNVFIEKCNYKELIPSQAIAIGIELFTSFNFKDLADLSTDNYNIIYNIIKYIIFGASKNEVNELISKMIEFRENEFNVRTFNLLNCISTDKPIEFLEYLLEKRELISKIIFIKMVDRGTYQSYFNNVDYRIILSWCNFDPLIRYPFVAEIVYPIEENYYQYQWTKFAQTLILKSSNPLRILNNFKTFIYNRTDQLSYEYEAQKILNLFAWLKESKHPKIVEWAQVEEKSVLNYFLNKDKDRDRQTELSTFE